MSQGKRFEDSVGLYPRKLSYNPKFAAQAREIIQNMSRRPNTDSDETLDTLEVEAYIASLEGPRKRWAEDVFAKGWIPREYRGRNMYVGPAVIIDPDDLQPIIRASEVNITWDAMGKHDLVVYPQ